MALRGLRVIELAGLAPSPFCGMVLADFGADVVRVDRVVRGFERPILSRGKRAIALDLKREEGVGVFKKLSEKADVLIEPFRPGVMEKLGLGPKDLMGPNPGLIYARLTGYGQSGPLSSSAGHDINYLAVAGVLSCLGPKDHKPHAPLNLLADFAGGGLSCAMGILLALIERQRSGLGQVIDSSMTEGAAYASSFIWATRREGLVWSGDRGENTLDGGAPNYNTYKTKDGQYIAVGALEPQFLKSCCQKLGLNPAALPDDVEKAERIFQEVFEKKTLGEWMNVFEKDSEACVSPVLNWDRAPEHPHNVARNSFAAATKEHALVPRPAPRLERTPAEVPSYEDVPFSHHSTEILRELGYEEKDIEKLVDDGVIGQEEIGDKIVRAKL